MTQIKNHTSEINNQSICNLQAQWCVSVGSKNGGNEYTAYGNTFAEALSSIYFDTEWRDLEGQQDITIGGYYELPNDLHEFDFAIDINSFDVMANYCFADGRITVEDLMAHLCKDTILDEYPDIYEHNCIDIPLRAFTCGARMAA